jgi:hypothetical protein
VRDRLQELYTVDVQLVEGGGGIFEISHNTRILFSKNILGYFPTDEDLVGLNLVGDFDN